MNLGVALAAIGSRILEVAVHRESDDAEPRWKAWRRYAVIGVVLIVVAAISATAGVYHQLSLHCRSKGDPAIYGIEYCVRPVKKAPARRAGASYMIYFTRAPGARKSGYANG